ncbi:MAG TPA: hypothetical protein VIJ59_04045 [Caulobacteraceae bacterium]
MASPSRSDPAAFRPSSGDGQRREWLDGHGRRDVQGSAARRYRDAGLADVTERYYPGSRHELFNEINRGQVMADLLTWLAEVLDERAAAR